MVFLWSVYSSVETFLQHLGGQAPFEYVLNLLYSNPLGSSKKFIGIDDNNGNLILKELAPATVQSQTYEVLVRSRINRFGKAVALIFKVSDGSEIFNFTNVSQRRTK